MQRGRAAAADFRGAAARPLQSLCALPSRLPPEESCPCHNALFSPAGSLLLAAGDSPAGVLTDRGGGGGEVGAPPTSMNSQCYTVAMDLGVCQLRNFSISFLSSVLGKESASVRVDSR